jgi:hypothetical protein
MALPSVRPSVRNAVVLALLATLGIVYFANTPIPGFLSRLRAVLLTLIIFWTAGSLGASALRILRVNVLNRAETIVFAMALGLGLLSWIMICLGIAPLWTNKTILLLIFVLVATQRDLFKLLITTRLKDAMPAGAPLLTLSTTLVVAGAAISFVLALAPITYYDSLVYHLAMPAAYVRAKHWLPLTSLIYSAFPQAMEMLWTLALLLRSEITANLIGWGTAMLLLASITAFGVRFFDRRVAAVAAALIAIMPAFLLLSSGGYVDVGLTMFSFLALYAVCLSAVPNNGIAITAGLFAGLAIGTKYTGALPAVLCGLLLLWLRYRNSQNLVKAAGLYAGGALLMVGPWLIKNTVFVGNPVFPFFYNWGIKALSPWVNEAAAGYFAGITEYYSRPLWALPLVLWDAAVNGMQFGRGIDVLGDFGWLPLLAFLPALWLARARPVVVRWLLAFAGGFFVLWAINRPVLRFMLPISPLLALLTGYAWVHGLEKQHFLIRWTARGFMTAFLVSGLFLFFYTTHFLSSFGVALGIETKSDYLARKLDYYPAATFVNRELPETARLYILGDQRGYYYERETVISPVFSKNPLMEWANAATDVQELAKKLQSQGITHVLINRSEFERLKSYPYARFTEHGERNWQELQKKMKSIYRDNACEVFQV